MKHSKKFKLKKNDQEDRMLEGKSKKKKKASLKLGDTGRIKYRNQFFNELYEEE